MLNEKSASSKGPSKGPEGMKYKKKKGDKSPWPAMWEGKMNDKSKKPKINSQGSY